jgi:hypothetical protein
MGYVAELQQFDESITTKEPEPALEGPQTEVAIEKAVAPARVPEKLPWTRIEVALAVVFVVVAATVVVGAAYALMERRRPTGEVALPLPMVAPSLSAAPAASPPAQAGVSPTPTAGLRGEDRQRSSPGAGPVPASPTPESATTAPVAAADLRATYARAANTGLLGLGGYRGEVTIRNEGAGAARDWEVTLSLPAGLEVSGASGAEFAQDGALVIFTPEDGAGAVSPGGSVVFTFDVPGLLAGEPTGCAIDGRPCA